jgi:hypothetical protein
MTSYKKGHCRNIFMFKKTEKMTEIIQAVANFTNLYVQQDKQEAPVERDVHIRRKSSGE